MVTELPPPPAPLVERLEASFPLPAALAPYEYLWTADATPPEAVPVRPFQSEEPENPVRLASGGPVIANPIQLLLDRLGSYLRPLFGETQHEKMPATENSYGGGPGGLGTDPVPTGDPIPVGGGGQHGG